MIVHQVYTRVSLQCVTNNLVVPVVEATNFVPVLISVPRARKTEIISFQIITLYVITRAIVKSRRTAIMLITAFISHSIIFEIIDC